MFKHLKPIIVKEFRQIRRDRRSLGVLLVLPAALVLLIGYAMNFDVKHVSIVVFDQEQSLQSRNLVEYFTHSEYFDVKYKADNYRAIEHLMNEGMAAVAIVIPPDYSRNLNSTGNAAIQILIDGSNANSATTIVGYTNGFLQSYSAGLTANALKKIGRDQFIPLDIRPLILYNPELISANFLVPGMIGFILMITGVVSTSLSIVKEKEHGTMEQLMISPLHTFEIILGKTLPYLIIGFISSILVVTIGFTMYHIVVQGSYLLLYASILLFLLAALGQGILISTVADNQQVAFMISIFSSLLPTFLLSGFVFPIRSMPLILQIVSNAAPAKYFLIITRSIVLKGLGPEAFWDQLIYLSLFAAIMLTVSSIRMLKKNA
ncbi:MAG: ABC transporter permease [Bacteroidota bacterium]